MTEQTLINRTPTPATVNSLAHDLARLGVQPGLTLLVHSSLKSLGWVCGGAVAVILALQQQLGPTGTLVMPTHSSDLSDPGEWENPPVPQSWWPTIRQTMPPFDPDLTPTRGMGVIPESFRKQRGVRRSHHPQLSFAAWGAQADFITQNHSLTDGLGEQSPLAKLYQRKGWVLLLGVDHLSNTSLHLAEYRASYPSKQREPQQAPIQVDGARQWVTYDDINLDETDFDRIGADFAAQTSQVRSGKVALADSLLMPQKPLVDFAVSWMTRLRQ